MEQQRKLINEYYILIDNLPRLSQKEIEELYESENIPYTDLDLEIKELQNKIEIGTDTTDLEKKVEALQRKKSSVSYRYYLTIVGRRHNIRRYPSKELRNKIVEGTMYLVIINAKIICKLENNRLSFDDLVQFGMEALLSAAYYYIPGGEATFVTYASKCIRNKMLRLMDDPKKMRKREGKIKDFFKKEKLKIKELEILLEVEKSDPEYNLCYRPNTEEHFVIHRLNRKIIKYNMNKDKREEHDLKINKVHGKSLADVLDRYSKLIKSSKLKNLVTDEERRDVEAYLNYRGFLGSELNYYRSQFYLEIYKYKIELLEKYILAENELLKRGEEPSVDNVVKLISEEIKKTNKKISELKSSGFFEECENSYMIGECFCYYPLRSFYEEYLEMYGVDLFASEDSLNSRTSEKELIISEYEDLYEDYKYFIEELERESSENVYVYLDENKKLVDVVSCVPFENLSSKIKSNYEDEEEYYFEQSLVDFESCYQISRQEVLNDLKEKLIALGSEDEYAKRILKERSDIVNLSLAEKNAPVIERNRKIKMMEDLYNLGQKYQKYLKKWRIENLVRDVNLLYDADPELIDLLLEQDKTRSKRLTVEETVGNNLFLEDYFSALEDLSDLEKKIMLLYYYRDGCNNLTLKEVADILGIKLDKVKKEKAKAIKKLRKNEKLFSYYNES